jgi:uncharacterized membrane protein
MNFLKTTLIGGLVFLVPIMIIVVILAKAHRLMVALSAPLAKWIPIDAIGGVALANLLAVAALVVLCFVAGFVARSSAAVRAVQSLESGFLTSIPGYGIIKGMTESLTGQSGPETMKPVLARFDDASQVAFEIERDPDGRVVVYIPGAPDPWSGSVFVMTADRVEPLEASMPAAVKNIRTLGRGTSELMRTRSRNETS